MTFEDNPVTEDAISRAKELYDRLNELVTDLQRSWSEPGAQDDAEVEIVDLIDSLLKTFGTLTAVLKSGEEASWGVREVVVRRYALTVGDEEYMVDVD